MRDIRFFDMFSGIGGFRSGLEAVGGFKCVGHCEIDKHANKAYNAIYNPQGEYYGDSPAPPHNELGYPNKKWAEIDGKEYYYNPTLYESINILQHENGEWEIVVTTEDADQNGQAMYSILNAGLLSLHVINLAVCVIWYLVKTKKRKTA